MPSELRVLVRLELGVADRRRMHHTCYAAYVEEAPDSFDFPQSWLRTIRRRRFKDHHETPFGRPPTQFEWLSDGDMARAVWSLGWHHWPGIMPLLAACNPVRVRFDAGPFWVTLADARTFGVRVSWVVGCGLMANGTVPVPTTRSRPRYVNLREVCRLGAPLAAIRYIKDLAAAHLHEACSLPVPY